MNALYDVDIVHVRAEPLHHEVHQRSYLWFIDVDDLPRLPLGLRWLARIDAAGYLGESASVRENVESFVRTQGETRTLGRITMLTNARSLGYAFNPLTLFWCHDEQGEVIAVVAEVHNTYGGRHRYLLHPDSAGRAETEKAFYVSPFYPVDGYYRMSVPEPGRRLAITITLHRPGAKPFTASVRGAAVPATTANVLRVAARHPLATWRVRAAITRHGITLWAKGLPIVPRTESGAAMSVAQRLESIVEDIAGVPLPVRIRAWDGSEAGPVGGPVAVIRNRRALRRLLWAPGELGLARAYVTGDLDVEGDLGAGLRQAWAGVRDGGPRTAGRAGLRARFGAARAAAGLGIIGTPPRPPASEARLSGRMHSRRRDRAAISHHYDLSNEFYELLLDDTMAYSSAYFEHDGQSLVDAQHAKLDLICTKLGLTPGQRLLDVGCGWGSMILHAAEHYGVRAHGVTLSAQQRDFIDKRIAERGLSDRVTVGLTDYRDLPAADYDAVSSIEMGEHVGEGQYPEYARLLHGSLRPGGRLLLQQMSRKGDAAPGGGAFIERYIAPDMHMRPLPSTMAYLEAAGFELRGVQALREHYVTTVAQWIDTLESRRAEFEKLVGAEGVRVWRLYLVGGALAFEQGRMGVDQILAQRPEMS